MSIKFLVVGRGGYFGFGGGECRFYFYGRADFSDKSKSANWNKSEENKEIETDQNNRGLLPTPKLGLRLCA